MTSLPFPRYVLAATALCLTFPASSLMAAELALDYDVSRLGAWQNESISCGAGNGPTQFGMGAMKENSTESISKSFTFRGEDAGSVEPDDFSPPKLVEGDGPGGRSYLRFEKYGALVADAADKNARSGSDVLNTGSTAEGYTLELLLRFGPDAALIGGGDIGFGGINRSPVSNAPLSFSFFHRGWYSRTAMIDESAPDPNSSAVSTKLPAADWFLEGAWVHYVKIHDPAKGEIRFYINGQLMDSKPLTNSVSTSAVYLDRKEYEAIVGTRDHGRVRGVDFGLFRAYRGVMSAEEVAQLHQSVMSGK